MILNNSTDIQDRKYGSSWAQRVQEKEQPTANINKNTAEARTHTKKMKEDLTV